MRSLIITLIASIAAASLGVPAPDAGAEQIVLATDGAAALPVVVGDQASERVRGAAEELCAYLARISGASFELRTGNGVTGIAVGLPQDFPQLGLDAELAVHDGAGRERYVLRSTPAGLLVVGATEQAVEHAVWGLLHSLGHRQFFPSATWEIVPSLDTIRVAVDSVEEPDYINRVISFGWGMWGYNNVPYQTWQRRNRMGKGLGLSQGHAYQAIVAANKAQFDAHPEYYALVGGERKSDKMCLSNPAVRELIVADRLQKIENNPGLDSVSMEPSDGSGWCECSDCVAMGSISDRALGIANEVAKAAALTSPGIRVGMYAYHQHSPPPTIQAEPNVVVSIATAFIAGPYSVDELFEQWGRAGATLGAREYYSVMAWDYDLPGKARAGNLAYLARTIPRFHECGARYLHSEASDNWGCSGLGYYLASRILWDIDQAKRVDEIREDFIARCFGEAAEPMREYYDLIDASSRPLFGPDLVGDMYHLLNDAWGRTSDPQVRERLSDLILYTRYVELHLYYRSPDLIPEAELGRLRALGQASNAADAQAASAERSLTNLVAEAAVRFIFRVRTRMIIHAKGLLRDQRWLAKEDRPPAAVQWDTPPAENRWRSDEPFTEDEVVAILQEGVAHHQPSAVEQISFGDDLVPLENDSVGVSQEAGTRPAYSFRGGREVYTWVHEAPDQIELAVTGGRIVGYRSRGNAKFSLWAGDDDVLCDEAEVPPDGNEHVIALKTQRTGLHVIRMTDQHVGTTVRFTTDKPLVLSCTKQSPAKLGERPDIRFYVPKGTRVIAGQYLAGSGAGLGSVNGPDGALAAQINKRTTVYRAFEVPVPAGQDGQVWTFRRIEGHLILLTVPPYVSLGGTPLLLPREVVENR